MRSASLLFVVVGGLGIAVVTAAGRPASAHVSQRVDFARDVQPILRQSCVGCHGPGQQMIGLRLDRRRDAMRGSTFGTVIGPGNAEASRLYRRISGTTDGAQMPPTGALSAEQIAVIKNWINEGADWPDAVSGETPPTPADPGAAALMSNLRSGDTAAFRRALAAAPAAATRQGADGITPLMYAALYGTVDEVRALLAAGADPNIRNEAGATALMWAADDVGKAKVLIDRGADVNARSLDGRTPLMLAAARAGSSAVLRLLLDKGADPNVSLLGLTALAEAAYAADPEAMRLLLSRGANPKVGTVIAVMSAAAADCRPCLELLLPSLDRQGLGRAAFRLVPPSDDGDELEMLLGRGVDVNVTDEEGRSLLMLAASSDSLPASVTRQLIAAGADVHARAKNGRTALGFAALRGMTPAREALTTAGAKADPPAAAIAAATPVPAHSPREAVARVLPIMQQTGVTFRRKAGCVSCHNNTLTARLTAEARRAGIAIDEPVARSEVSGIAGFIETWRERALQGLGIPGDADTVSYIMLGLADEKHPADPATDAMARFLKNRQLSDGSWRTVAHRPPIESSDIMVTALSMRALQNYAPARLRAQYDVAVRAGARWLASQTPDTVEARAGQLLGLNWAGGNRDRINGAARALASAQRSDGGWAQLNALGSDAYATGQALVALHDGAGMATNDPVYQRGVAFLLGSQHADGTWHTPSRALAIQPLFDIGFPHGDDSWISAAATNWAAIALALASGAR
jgi:ankyrin repeat protein